MISVLLNSSSMKELKYLEKCVRYYTSAVIDDDWNCHSMLTVSELIDYLDMKPLIDLACVDISPEKGIVCAKKVRSLNGNTMLVVITDATVSPITYITPDVMPTALILRPFDTKHVQSTIRQILKAYTKLISDVDNSNKYFMVENRDGHRPVPFERIRYFEARDKKVYLICDGEEFSFYDTIDNLEKSLPSQFIRCHRGFIVNSSCITKIMLSQNTVVLDDGDEVPLSRSYKKNMKELSVV